MADVPVRMLGPVAFSVDQGFPPAYRGRRSHVRPTRLARGLPTERYVERVHVVRNRRYAAHRVVDLCLAETRRVAAGYERLWRRSRSQV